MPTFRLADDPDSQQRLGDAVGNLPVEVQREGATISKVIRMPAWTSFVIALVAHPERAFVVTDQGEATALRHWVAQYAPGTVVDDED